MEPKYRWVSLSDVAAPVPNAIVDGPFGSNLKLEDYVDDGIPVLQGKNITGDEFAWKEVRYISERKANELKRSTVRPGDILLVKIGSIGYSAIIEELSGFPFAIIPANLAKITPNSDLIHTKFLHYWLTSPDAKAALLARASKTAQPALSLTKIKELPVPLPPLAEQRRIAAILDNANAMRSARRKTLQQHTNLRLSLFLDTFGDPATNPKRWPLRQIREIAVKISDGPFGSNLKTSHYTESGIRVIRLQNIGVGEFLDEDKAFISESHFSSLRKHECAAGDVLVGTLGDPNLRACIMPRTIGLAINKADCVQIRPNPSSATSDFVCALLNLRSTERMATGMIHGQTRSRISMGRLRELHIPMPPIELQREFTERTAKAESVRAAALVSAADLDRLFSSLRHRAFRGEL